MPNQNIISLSANDDEKFIERSIELSRIAVKHGNHPFGSLLVDPKLNQETEQNPNNSFNDRNQGNIIGSENKNTETDPRIIMEACNTVVTESDPTRHAELNLVSAARRSGISAEQLRRCTLYTSTEPCCMCCGAIFWCGVGRIVYACSTDKLGEIVERKTKERGEVVTDLHMPSRSIMSHVVGMKIKIEGPIKENKAAKEHEAYW